MSKYDLAFKPAAPPAEGAPLPHVIANNRPNRSTAILPCTVDSGTYTLVWVLFGNPGATAPVTITAKDASGVNKIPDMPIGVDANGQPIAVVNSAAHDWIYNYKLP